MDKNTRSYRYHMMQQQKRYSLKKLSVGLASVATGTVLFINPGSSISAEELVAGEGSSYDIDQFVSDGDTEVVAEEQQADDESVPKNHSNNEVNTEGSTDVETLREEMIENENKDHETENYENEEIESEESNMEKKEEQDSAELEEHTTEQESDEESEELAPLIEADSFTADNPATREAIEEALNNDHYLSQQYTIAPSPRDLRYLEGASSLRGTVNIVASDDFDKYTLHRLREILQVNQISYQTSQQYEEGAFNILLGVRDKESEAKEHQQDLIQDRQLYDRIDGHSIVIKDNTLSIVGNSTDAVFYGLTTVKHLLNQVEVPVLRNMVIEDYADMAQRGYIEGYYGNPWSVQDRIELMKYGGDLKLNQYLFAPKDDEYHNRNWRTLYPDDKLADIKKMAEVGNRTKNLFVWTLHPFMHDAIRFDTDEHYNHDLDIVKQKFTQLMDNGVRKFGILADDARAQQPEDYVKIMKDLTTWLNSKKSEYSGLSEEMIFVPQAYGGKGTERELRHLNKHLPTTTDIGVTGGRVWGEASQSFLELYKQNVTKNGENSYRPPYMWINWPVTDNAKKHLILGGGENFLHPGVDPDLIEGIMLNPMQQSEASKIAIFSGAEYTWNIWDSVEDAQAINDLAFHFADHGTFESTEASNAFKELGKHMINQNMDRRVVALQESVDLAPKLQSFMEKLKNKESSIKEEAEQLQEEFELIRKSAEKYIENPGNKRMKDQIIYWLRNAIDISKAANEFLNAFIAIEENSATVFDHYIQGVQDYEKSKTHEFWYVDHYERAELGVQHIRPFILESISILSDYVNRLISPVELPTFISNRQNPKGDIYSILSGELSTHLIYDSPNKIEVGDYIGVEYENPIQLTEVHFAMGQNNNLNDTFSEADIEYRDQSGQWHKIKTDYVGNEANISLTELDLTVTGIRLVATKEKERTWLGIRGISVNKPFIQDEGNNRELIVSENLSVRQGKLSHIIDNKDDTVAMLARGPYEGDNRDQTPADAYLMYDLGKLTDVSQIRFLQDSGTDKITSGRITYADENNEWHDLAAIDGRSEIVIEQNIKARYIAVVNHEQTNYWWRIYDFSITTPSLSDYGYTNKDDIDTLRVETNEETSELTIPDQLILKPGEYIGMKLDRIREISKIDANNINDNLLIEYANNEVEWQPLNGLTDGATARYIRVINQSDSNQTVTATSLKVVTKEVKSPALVETTFDEPPKDGTELALFDNQFNTETVFRAGQKEGDYVLYDLGTDREIKSIRGYVQDSTSSYLRDGKIQISADGQEWTDVVTIGDGEPNEQKNDSLTDGYTHDSQNPGNRYIEGVLDASKTARYVRILVTADYPHEYLSFNKLVFNNSEYWLPVNNPTIHSEVPEKEGHLPSYIDDSQVLTSYRPDADQGEFIYRLSESTKQHKITTITNSTSGIKLSVSARVSRNEDGSDSEWTELGEITESKQTFVLEDIAHLFELKFKYNNGAPTIYEIITESVKEDTENDTTSESFPTEGNVLLGAEAAATNEEDNTAHTADKAIDGNGKTRWATDRDVENPSLTLTLKQLSKIKTIEIDWDKRNGESNIDEWELLYATESADNTATGVTKWQVAHHREGNPTLSEQVVLEQAITAKYLKLNILNYSAGSLGWRNVGISEIRALPNVPKQSSLDQIEALTLNADETEVLLPQTDGQLRIKGSNKPGVIDQNGRVYKPLTNQEIKLMLEENLDGKIMTKEITVQVKGQYEDEGTGESPKVNPVVQQWHGIEGTTSITQHTTLVAEDDMFRDVVEIYQKDLQARGLNLAQGSLTDNSHISFQKVLDKGYGKEGYGITIENGKIMIDAADRIGALYATRTLLQMGETDLQNGYIRDFPSNEHRGFMIDTGRKFIPYERIMDILETMAYYKLNDLQLHLNDNYIFLKEHLKGKEGLSTQEQRDYVLNNAVSGFRLESSFQSEDGKYNLTSDQYYTNEQMQSIIKRGEELGINVVPEIDTPGHALSFTRVRPDLIYQGQLTGNHHDVERVAMLDLSDEKYEETFNFVTSVYDELLDGPLKGIKTIHVGTDEYYGDNEAYRRYANDLLNYIKSKGITPRIWGSLSSKTGQTPVDFNDVEVSIWSLGWQKPDEALQMGAKIINITDRPTYSVPSGDGSIGAYADFSDYVTQYNQWIPSDFRTGRGPKLNESNPNILGGAFAIWNDNIDLHDTGMTSYDIFTRFFKTLPVVAERTWGSDRAPAKYQDRTELPAERQYAPQTNPTHRVKDEQLFTLSSKTIDKFDHTNVENTNYLHFEKDSQVNTNLQVGPGYTLTVDVMLTEEGNTQVLATDGTNTIYLADNEGKVAYDFEQYHVQFDTELPRNKPVRLQFVTTVQETILYVDGIKQALLPQENHPKFTHNTLVMPLEKIGGFSGVLSRVELTKDAMEDPAIVKDAIESVETNSQELNGTATEGPIELAFDHDKRTIWHSKWGEKEKDYTVNIALKEKTNLTGLAYIPRQDKSNNGNILTYEVYVEKDNELVKEAEGNWENSKSVKYAKFENTIETTKVQLKVLKGEKGFASAAAIQLLQDIEIAPIFEEEIIAPEKSDKPGGSSDSESSSSEGLITQKEEAATQIGKLSALRVADINKFIVAIALADTVEEINEILQRAIELNDQLQEDIEERNKTDKGEGIVQPEKPKFEGGMNGIGLVNEKPEFPSEEIERLLQVERDNASRYIATLPNLDNSRMKEFQVMIKEAKTTLVIEEVIKEAEKLNNKLGQLSSEQSTESEETPKDQSDTVEATFAFTNNDGSVHRGSLGKFANLEQAERRIRQYANELGYTLQSFHLDNGTFLAEVDADFSQPLPAPEQPEETPAPKAEAAFEFVLENGSVHRGSLGEFTSLEQAERRIRHFANEQGYTLQNFRIEDGKFLASVKEMDK